MDKYIGNNFHSLHYGDFKVLGYDTISGKRQRYIVKFSKTGTIKSAARYAIASGNVKDPYYPAILGVGCVGNVVVKGNNYIYIKRGKICYVDAMTPNVIIIQVMVDGGVGYQNAGCVLNIF